MGVRPKTSSSEITYAKHPDKGCQVSPSCFACPLPACKYDDYPAYLKWMQAKLVAPVQTALELRSVAEVAKQFGLTERTIFRIKTMRKGGGQ